MKFFRAWAALILGLLMGACGSRPDRVLIGIGLASNSYPGIMLAVNEINSRGGIRGVPLEAVGMDWQQRDSYGATTVLEYAARFAETRDLFAVIGHSDSASTLSAAGLYNRRNIPQLVTVATNPAITNIGTWTYRICISDAAQGPALAQYAVKDWGKRRIATYFVNDEYGRDLSRLFEKRARELGAEIVASVMHRNVLQSDDEEMIASTMAEMKKTGPPDLIALFERFRGARRTVEAMRKAGIVADLLGSDNLAQTSFIQENPALAEGMRISQFYVPQAGNPGAEQFERNFRSLNGFAPDYAEAFAYDAIYLLRDAVLHGGYSRQGVKNYLDRLILEKTPIQGVGGLFTLGPDHDARRALNIVEVRKGEFHFLKSLPVN